VAASAPGWALPADTPLQIDTWVQLTLEDETGAEFSLRRAQTRNARGKIEEVTSPSFSELNIDPMAFRIATLMPAMLPYIRPGDKSELGSAVGELTGLSEITLLSKHASRVQQRITDGLISNRTEEIREKNTHLAELAKHLSKCVAELPWLSGQSLDWLDSPDTIKEGEVSDLMRLLAKNGEDSLAQVTQTLGIQFELENGDERKGLVRDLTLAGDALSKIGTLPSAIQLKALKELSEEELQGAESLVERLQVEAETLAELSANPSYARRVQLYALVASWLRVESEPNVEVCPVCQTHLEGIIDPVTRLPVTEHLLGHGGEGKDFVGKALPQWIKSAEGQLKSDLPAALQKEMQGRGSSSPAERLRSLICEELFQHQCFAGPLRGLGHLAEQLCRDWISPLPTVVPSKLIEFPPIVASQAGSLLTSLNRVTEAIAIARWRQNHSKAVAKAYSFIFGSGAQLAGDYPPDSANTLFVALHKLTLAVATSKPTFDALEICQKMREVIAGRSRAKSNLKRLKRLEAALEPIMKLGNLVQVQVESLRLNLDERTKFWRGRIYRKTHSGTHELAGIDLDAGGVVDFQVDFSGATAPVKHVSNASALRANLLGFFLAFRESVLETRGGLRLLVLDDPQELLDVENRERLAEAIPEFIERQCQLLLTSHDPDFSRLVAHCGRGKFSVDHRSVSPVCTNRPTLLTPAALDRLQTKRQIFERPENENEAAPAQDYIAEYRIFLEARLGDFFDEPAFAAGARLPTLSDFLNRMRSKRTSGYEFFTSAAVKKFCDHPSLADGSELLKLLNKAHHKDKYSISFMDVDSVKDQMKDVQSSLLDIHEEFRRWQKREEPTAQPTVATKLHPLTTPSLSLPIFFDLAACTAYDDSNPNKSFEERLSEDWFQDKALYRVMSHSLGWSAPFGSIVIVESEPQNVEDRRLVIAIVQNHVLARRLVRSYDERSKVGLVAESTDPTKRPPSRLFHTTAVQLHKIVGVLFDTPPHLPRSKDEAIPLEDAASLGRLQVAFQIRDTSALPLALDGQIVLGGKKIAPSDFAAREGALAAIALDDGRSVFKRISHALPADLSHIRQFESIGGLGESLLAAVEDVDGRFSRFPTVVDAREILGVLYI